MRLFVLGNISSGKSYVIEKLKEILHDYDVVKIDDYRIKYCDGSLSSELRMWEEFPKEILKYPDTIIELSGGGKVAENILKLLDENSFLVLKVNTDIATCIERTKDKDFSKIPYPKEFCEPLEETIRRIGNGMDEGSIEKTWAKAINIIPIASDSDLSKLPLLQYHVLFKLRNVLKEFEGSLFTFGSTGRGMMKNTSDVDTYFLTKTKKEDIYHLLINTFQSVHVMADEFVIRENGILLEMNWIDDIHKADLFYNRSLIKNPLKTILKDDYHVINHLIEVSKEEFDKKKEIIFTIERLEYYVASLPVLIEKEDEYKYYFHNNIVVHEYVKLKAFLSGVFEFSYLPLNAKKYLSEEEWKNIIYMFGDDQKKHYEKVKIMSEQLIKNINFKYSL